MALVIPLTVIKLNTRTIVLQIVDYSFKIPNLCKNSSVFVVLIVVEALALSISLLSNNVNFTVTLGLVSLYCQWCALLACTLLCLSRNYLNAKQSTITAVASFVLIVVPFGLIELGLYFLFPELAKSQGLENSFITRLMVVILYALVTLRFFTILTLLEDRSRAEMQQRMLALQAKIKPHFLFNSLNTISELAAIKSDHAEEAIQSLAMLFRVSLEETGSFHSLEKEIKLCERYISLEMWRIENGFNIDWEVEIESSQKILVPKLILQPLVENALKYGANRGSINNELSCQISIKESNKDVYIMIRNPVIRSQSQNQAGNGIAIDNIKERLFVLYDDEYSFKTHLGHDSFRVTMKFPKTSSRA